MSKNYIIPKPPGGTLTCDDDQVGIVDVINGEVHASCSAVPSKVLRLDNPSVFLEWAKEVLAGGHSFDMSKVDEGILFQRNQYDIPRLRQLGVVETDEVASYYFILKRFRNRL